MKYGVESAGPEAHRYRLVSRAARSARSIVRVGQRAAFGGAALAVCAGPCSVESREQLETTAAAVAKAGANVLRGGAFKPRTSPYAFAGLGEEG
ncbi:MAG: 3-deoxy-7-phosphoheptulonate synthase, partial [Candidatus Eremiobacteraeota bacterium]|nr:3-deoxy-7-phosphoheptulonate synthase [Candidatus Eremiobacteraeota bacterium]